MLSAVVEEFENAQGPLTLADMSRRLGIDRSALEGMIQFLVRKGTLRQVGPDTAACAQCGLRSGCAYHQSGGLMGTAYELVKSKA